MLMRWCYDGQTMESFAPLMQPLKQALYFVHPLKREVMGGYPQPQVLMMRYQIRKILMRKIEPVSRLINNEEL